MMQNYIDLENGSWGEVSFIAVFEEKVDFRRIYQLPCNLLVGILDDGGMNNSPIYDIVNQEWHDREKGQLYFNPCNQKIMYETHPNLHYIAIHFRLELYPGIDLFQDEKHWIFEYAPDEVKRLEVAFRTQNPLLRFSRLKEFCLHYCNRHWPENTVQNWQCERFEKVLNYMKTHVAATTTVNELAAMMDIRPETFSREFSLAFGISPKDYLQNLLTSHAITLLQQPNLSIKKISKTLGFSSEFYFSKFFKRRTGSSPANSRFRQVNGKVS